GSRGPGASERGAAAARGELSVIVEDRGTCRVADACGGAGSVPDRCTGSVMERKKSTEPAAAAAAASASPRVPLPLSLGLGSGSMLPPLNSSMIAVAIIAIADRFGPIEGTAWVISGLYIATAVVSPAAGRLGALFGPRRMYLGGLGAIAAGSVLGALAPSLAWLIVARVVQGVGTASQYPTAMMIIRR